MDTSDIRRGEYGQALCPMPECDAELYCTISIVIPVDVDTDPADLRVQSNGVSEQWVIECTDGHQLLRPATDADTCQFGGNVDYPDDGPDEGVLIDDLARLHRVLRMQS